MEIIMIAMARDMKQGRQAKKKRHVGEGGNGDEAIWRKGRQMVQSATQYRLEECS